MAGLAGASLLVLAGAPTRAQLNNAGTFKNLTNEQTSPSTVSATGGFFNAQAFFTNPGDYTSASLTVSGGPPQDLPMTSPTAFGIGPGFPSQAAMDAAYPFGTYVISLTAGTQPATSVTLDYTADAYASAIPQLSAASFDALQGLSSGLGSLTLTYNSFSPSPLATSAFTFFTIFGTTQGCSFQGSSSTSCTIDPHALAAHTAYTWELDFSDRIESTVNGVLTYTDFDVRTDGSFTTAAPEPSTWAMALAGFAGLSFVARQRKRTLALA
jgi:hypothetical protein